MGAILEVLKDMGRGFSAMLESDGGDLEETIKDYTKHNPNDNGNEALKVLKDLDYSVMPELNVKKDKKESKVKKAGEQWKVELSNKKEKLEDNENINVVDEVVKDMDFDRGERQK